jgi:C4-dicarboxylate transporter
MASTQSLFPLFVEPANRLGVDLHDVGAVVSLAAAAGRSISPVATVTLMCASMTRTDPFALVRRLAVPLLISTTIVIAVAVATAASPAQLTTLLIRPLAVRSSCP